MFLRYKRGKLVLLITAAVMAGVCLYSKPVVLKQDRRYSRYRFRRAEKYVCLPGMREIDGSRFINCTSTGRTFSCELPPPVTIPGASDQPAAFTPRITTAQFSEGSTHPSGLTAEDVEEYEKNLQRTDLSQEEIRDALGKAVNTLRFLRSQVQEEKDATKLKSLIHSVQNKTIGIANFVLSNQRVLSDRNQEQLLTGVLHQFEKLGPVLASNLGAGESVKLRNPNVEMTTTKGNDSAVSGQLAKVGMEFMDTSFSVTRSQHSRDNPLAVSGVIFKATDKVLLSLLNKMNRKADSTESLVINTDHLMISVANPQDTPQEHKVEASMTFRLKRTGLTNPRCYSFLAGDLTPSQDGCKGKLLNISHAQCICSHLTSFTVLMSVQRSQHEESNTIMPVLTNICLPLSVFFLLLSFATFVYFKNLKSDRNTIHINLSISLALAQLVFLIGSEQVHNKVACAIVAGLLQFLFLTAFSWMAAEGLQTYIKLIIVFTPKYSMIPIYMAIGYGVPTVVVVVSAALYSEGYGTSRICWLTTKRWFHFSFIGPVLAIVLWNSIMVVVAVYVMCRQQRFGVQKQTSALRLKQIKSQVKGVFSLLILFGVSWLVGLINFQSAGAQIFGYVFILLNGGQGVFIFFFHCFGNKMVKREYRRWLRNTSCLPEGLRRTCFRMFKSESDEDFSKTTNTTKETSTWGQGRMTTASVVTFGPTAPQARTSYKDDLAKDMVFLTKAFTPKDDAYINEHLDSGVYLGESAAGEAQARDSRAFTMKEVVVPEATAAMLEDAGIYLGEEAALCPPKPLPPPVEEEAPPPSVADVEDAKEEAVVEEEEKGPVTSCENSVHPTESIFGMMLMRNADSNSTIEQSQTADGVL